MTTMHRNALPTNRPTDRPTLPRPLLWLLVLAIWHVLALPATARAAAVGPLVLPADSRPVNVWSVATLLADPSQRWGVQDALARLHEFAEPPQPGRQPGCAQGGHLAAGAADVARGVGQ